MSGQRTRRGLTAAAVLASLALPASAAGHAVVVDTEPQRAEHLDQAPAEVVLTFNEPVKARAGDIRVYDSSSERVDTGAVSQPRDSQAAAEIQDGIPKDVYTTTYRVVSADGHPVSGGFAFAYGRGVGADSPGPTVAELLDRERSTSVDVAYAIVRGLHYLALLLTIGAVAFAAFVAPRGADAGPRLRRVLIAAALVGGACSLAGVGLQGALAAAAPLDRSFARDTIEVSIDNRAGLAWVARGLVWAGVLALVVLAARWPRVVWPRVLWALAAASLAIVASLPLAGHARTQDPSAVLIPADFVHVVAAGAWLGGLLLLLLVHWPRRGVDTATAWAAAQRFSRLALPAMAALVAAGALQAVFYLSAPGDLVSEDYGLVLSAKIALLLAILAIAASNRRAIAREAASGTAARLRRAMRAEVGLAVAVIAAASILVRTAPPEAAEAGPPTPVVDLGPMRLEMSIEPGATGTNAAHLYFFDRRSGAQVDGIDELRLTLTPPDGDPRTVAVPRKSFAHYQLDRLALPDEGEWRLRVQAHVRSGRYAAETTIDVE
ncbi:MAG TPA: copper resistance protein CopC [Thermoleophilaceae bacterium]|jgi:copper transport protein